MRHFRGRYVLLALLALLAVIPAACGGDDEEAATGITVESLDQRLAGIEGYIAAQVRKENERPGLAGVDGYVAEPVYALKRRQSSENEQAIVLFLAECSVESYLNPGLPDQIRDREIQETEDKMWEALEAGQYVSFETYIGQAFTFCEATLVEDN